MIERKSTDNWLGRWSNLIYAIAYAVGAIVSVMFNGWTFVTGMMIGGVFVCFALWAIRYQDLVQWRLNKAGRHYHNGKYYLLVEDSDVAEGQGGA